MKIDKNKTLEELDGEVWEKPEFNSQLVITIHALRKKQLKDFSVEDLRICLGQQLFLEYLVPLGITILETNPFSEGDYYPGDLLKNIIMIKEDYWLNHSSQKNKIKLIIDKAISNINSLKKDDKQKFSDLLIESKNRLNHIP